MRAAAALVLCLALASKPLVAAELRPFLKDEQLGVALRSIALPATIPRDLVSGLTNTLLIHVALLSGARQVDQRTAEIAIKYDLWDETFTWTVTVHDVVVSVRPHASRAEIDALLADIHLPGLFATNEVPGDRVATLRVEVLLNPIERERIEAIKKWVAENSTYTPADTPGYSDKRVGSSRSNAIFNGIFGQYAGGTGIAAAWKQSVSSEPFTIAAVPDEPPL
jgi:hypothetical protein